MRAAIVVLAKVGVAAERGLGGASRFLGLRENPARVRRSGGGQDPGMRLGLVVFALTLALASPAGAATFKGKLVNGKGWRVAALAPDGRAAVRRVGASGRFSLTLPTRRARRATLHLIGPSGRYFGPVVLRRERRLGYLRFNGGSVWLGSVVRSQGAARPRRDVPRRLVDRGSVTRLTFAGRLRGAGKLGLVEAPRRALVSQDAGQQVGGDGDADGIPGPFDVDDDGDTILDTSDPSGVDGSGSTGGFSGANLSSSLPLGLEDSLNANATGVTRALVDQRLVSDLNIVFTSSSEPEAPSEAVNVDCGGLSYCRPGDGTADILNGQTNTTVGKWVDFDPDQDGLPNLPRAPERGLSQIQVLPRATTAQIAPGDTFTFVRRRGEVTDWITQSLVQYPTTTPAVRTYDAGAGNVTVNYPVPAGTPGTRDEPIQLTSDSLTLEFWRPQRLAIEGAETGTFIDSGHLNYGIRLDVEDVCRFEDYSNLSPTLSRAPEETSSQVHLRDSADDAAPEPSNLLRFTVNVSACIRRAGADPATRKNYVLTLIAEDDAFNVAGQHLNIRMP
jgi:hypothetical protein